MLRNTIDLHDLEPSDIVAMRRLLARTYAVIHDPKHHTVGVEARDANGCAIGYYEPDAEKFCLLGGKNLAASSLGMDIFDTVPQRATELLNECAVDLYEDRIDEDASLYVAAQVNDNLGHEAALALLRCGVKKLRAVEKEVN